MPSDRPPPIRLGAEEVKDGREALALERELEEEEDPTRASAGRLPMVMASRLTARIERRTDCDLYIWISFKSLRVKQIRGDLLLRSDSPGLGFSVVGALRNVRHTRVLRVQRFRDHFERSERTFGRRL